jgi:hypothetical protein
MSALIAAGCHSGAADISTTPPPKTLSRVSVVTRVDGVTLWRPPASVASTCEVAQSRTSIPLLCPTAVPRATVGTPAGAKPPKLVSNVLSDSGELWAIQLVYSAPSETDMAANKPSRFFHFLLLAGPQVNSRVHDELQGATVLGTPRLGGQVGTLLYQPNISTNQHHLVFIFRRNTWYAASLHAWAPRSQAIAVLGAIVSHLERAK